MTDVPPPPPPRVDNQNVGKDYKPNPNPGYSPGTGGGSFTNSKGEKVTIKEGPADGKAPVPITKTTGGDVLTQVAPGIYAMKSGQIIQTYGARQDPAVTQFLKDHPSLNPGIYASQDSAGLQVVYAGQKTRDYFRDYSASDIFQNPALVDPYQPYRSRQATPDEKSYAAAMAKNQPPTPTEQTLHLIDQEGNGAFAGQPGNTAFQPAQKPNPLQLMASDLYAKSYNAGEAYRSATTPAGEIIPAVEQAAYGYGSLAVGTVGNLEYKRKEFLIGAGTGAVFEAVTIAAERAFGNVVAKITPVVGIVLTLAYIGAKTNQFVAGSPGAQASFPTNQTSSVANFEKGKATFEYTTDFTAGAVAEVGGFMTGAKAIRVVSSPADLQFIDRQFNGDQVPTRVEYRPGNFRTEDPVVSITRGQPIREVGMKDVTNSATPYQGFLDRRGEVGGRSAKQRAGRISKAELSQRKGPAANQLKYEVTTTPQEQVAELRGKGRFDQSVPRIESVRFERQPTVTVRTSNNPEQFQGMDVTRTNEFQPVAARIVARGEPATRIRPSNEPPAPTEMYRPSAKSMDHRGKTPYFSGSKETPKTVEAPGRQVQATVTENVAKSELKTGTITSGGFQPGEQVSAMRGRQSFSPRSRLIQEIPGSTPITQEEFQAIRQGRSNPGYGSSQHRTSMAMDRLRAAREALRSGRVPATQGPRDMQPQRPTISSRPASANDQHQVQVPRIGTDVRQSELQATAEDQSLRFFTPLSSDLKAKTITVSSQAVGQDQEQAQAQAQRQNQIQIQIPVQEEKITEETKQRHHGGFPITTPGAGPVTPPVPPIIPPEPVSPINKPEPGNERQRQRETPNIVKFERPTGGPNLFDVHVRRQGKFTQINNQGLRLEDAFKLGTNRVQNTLAASFQIIDERTNEPVRSTQASQFLGSQFGSSKKNPDVFVQGRNFRLGTPGEKVEIRAAQNNLLLSHKKKGGRSLWA